MTGVQTCALPISAANSQNQAYFIKGTDSCLYFDSNGTQIKNATCAQVPVNNNNIVVSAPYLTITKSDPSPTLVASSQSVYQLYVTNSGAASTSTAQVKDQLPSGLTFVSATGANWACSSSGSPALITCNFSGSTIAAGSTVSIAVTVQASAGTGGQSKTNYASVDSTGGVSAPTPGSGCTAAYCSSNTTTVQAAPAPILSVSKSAPTPGLVVGSQSNYTLTVTNDGPGNATTAQVKDQLPSGLTFVSATGTNWTCTTSGTPTLITDRKSTRLNSSHIPLSRMPSSA